jgi:hypothetical protein
MHKSAFKFELFLMASLIVLSIVAAVIPISKMNFFSDAMAQGYDEYDSKSYNNNNNKNTMIIESVSIRPS